MTQSKFKSTKELFFYSQFRMSLLLQEWKMTKFIKLKSEKNSCKKIFTITHAIKIDMCKDIFFTSHFMGWIFMLG